MMKTTTLLLGLSLALFTASCQKEEEEPPAPLLPPYPTYYPVRLTAYPVPDQLISVYVNGSEVDPDQNDGYYVNAITLYADDTLLVRTRITDVNSTDTGNVTIERWRMMQELGRDYLTTTDDQWQEFQWIVVE